MFYSILLDFIYWNNILSTSRFLLEFTLYYPLFFNVFLTFNLKRGESKQHKELISIFL